MRSVLRYLVGFLAAIIFAPAVFLSGPSASAATIDWAAWSNTYTAADPGGLATASLTSNGVTYTGQVLSVVANYPSWNPASTFSGGTVGNPPPSSGGIVQLQGGNSTVNTITFASSVSNPVMAIWSLGQAPPNSSINAEFDFIGAPFTIQSGGPSAEYGGVSITSSGDTVYGFEGNGTIQFSGTYSSISWTNPVNEYWYGFTVGVPNVNTSLAAPLPAALPLFASGLGALGVLGWRKRKGTRAA